MLLSSRFPPKIRATIRYWLEPTRQRQRLHANTYVLVARGTMNRVILVEMKIHPKPSFRFKIGIGVTAEKILHIPRYAENHIQDMTYTVFLACCKNYKQHIARLHRNAHSIRVYEPSRCKTWVKLVGELPPAFIPIASTLTATRICCILPVGIWIRPASRVSSHFVFACLSLGIRVSTWTDVLSAPTKWVQRYGQVSNPISSILFHCHISTGLMPMSQYLVRLRSC
jgi:hypothetical protein